MPDNYENLSTEARAAISTALKEYHACTGMLPNTIGIPESLYEAGYFDSSITEIMGMNVDRGCKSFSELT